MRQQRINWTYFLFEILSIFIAVLLAFGITRWNDYRKDRDSETKILLEIKNGLERDLEDFRLNIYGHREGLRHVAYFRDLLQNRPVPTDSLDRRYLILLRDFISIQNRTGYESLKSQGLKLVQNDQLRYEIISLYDFSYQIIQKLEEEYSEMQFNDTYFHAINEILAPHLVFDAGGQLVSIRQPLRLPAGQRSRLLSYLWRIESNRRYTLREYQSIEDKIVQLISDIEQELE